ncbi:MAG: T9SS type A sorting domain-containing protein [Candidatus Coatesbacteria bacterium]|nr:T9SS type A sorting domain-containing protein [Candidatus Coatesbacteria bacterium]
MKCITILILLGLLSSLYSAPGDFLGTVHEFDKNSRIRGLGFILEDSDAYLGELNTSFIYRFDFYSWSAEDSWLFTQDSEIRSIACYKPLNDIAISGGESNEVFILNLSDFNIKKAFETVLPPAKLDYIQTLAEDSVYLRVCQFRGKVIMRYSLPNYDFKDSQMSDIITLYENSSFCGICYDIDTNYLIVAVYQRDGSTFKGLDLFALDPVTLARIHHVPLTWASYYFYELRYVSDYPGYGRCYIANYFDIMQNCNKIIAIEPFEGEGFKDKSSSSSLPTPSLSISPNPFSTRLSVFLPSSGAIYSLTGQLIINLAKGKYSIDTSKWREGVYIVKSGKETKRIVKIN